MYKVVVDTVMLNGEPAGKDCYVADSIEIKCGLLEMWIDEDTVMTYPMYRVKSVEIARTVNEDGV